MTFSLAAMIAVTLGGVAMAFMAKREFDRSDGAERLRMLRKGALEGAISWTAAGLVLVGLAVYAVATSSPGLLTASVFGFVVVAFLAARHWRRWQEFRARPRD